MAVAALFDLLSLAAHRTEGAVVLFPERRVMLSPGRVGTTGRRRGAGGVPRSSGGRNRDDAAADPCANDFDGSV